MSDSISSCSRMYCAWNGNEGYEYLLMAWDIILLNKTPLSKYVILFPSHGQVFYSNLFISLLNGKKTKTSNVVKWSNNLFILLHLKIIVCSIMKTWYVNNKPWGKTTCIKWKTSFQQTLKISTKIIINAS